MENLESPKKRKRNKYPVGQKKRRKVITSGLRRGRKPKINVTPMNLRENSTIVSETLTECFKIVNSADNEGSAENFDANPSVQDNRSSDDDSSENKSIQSDNSDDNLEGSYIDMCENDIVQNNLLRRLLRKFQEADLLTHFMAFVNGICADVIKATNISILLAMEYCYMMSLSNTTKMRYRIDTCKFWETALAVGGPRLIRLFSSEKHFGQVNSGESQKSKYKPKKGNFNFAVPDEKILKKSKTNILNIIGTGVIEDGINMLDPNKEYIISLDGKQTGKGLKDIGQGDVDLWGFEGLPTLQATIEQNNKELNFFQMLALKLMDEDDLCEDAMKELKLALQINSHKVKNLREAKVRHEILRTSFQNKIRKFPDQGNWYVLAFAEIDAFIAKSNIMITKLLDMNVKWCKIMADVNGNSRYFRKDQPIRIDDQDNCYMLLKDDFMDLMYGSEFLEQNPQYVKQRSDKWFQLRKKSWVTGSTMHNALGLRNLKSQKLHFNNFLTKTSTVPEEPNDAMIHGSKHEVRN